MVRERVRRGWVRESMVVLKIFSASGSSGVLIGDARVEDGGCEWSEGMGRGKRAEKPLSMPLSRREMRAARTL